MRQEDASKKEGARLWEQDRGMGQQNKLTALIFDAAEQARKTLGIEISNQRLARVGGP